MQRVIYVAIAMSYVVLRLRFGVKSIIRGGVVEVIAGWAVGWG